MSDKRNQRKSPSGLVVRANPRLVLSTTCSLDGSDQLLAHFQESVCQTEVFLTRSDARKVRDWLNHFIEWSAEIEARNIAQHSE